MLECEVLSSHHDDKPTDDVISVKGVNVQNVAAILGMDYVVLTLVSSHDQPSNN